MKNQAHLPANVLIELLESQRYGVEYQPIINLNSGDIFSFECLARFFDSNGQPLRPDLVYSSLHDSPLTLFQVEYQQKLLQLDHAPSNHTIFVNLDQDSYFSSCDDDQQNPFLTLFKGFKKSKLVIELIENSEINDAIMSLAMIDNLAQENISTAIDDVCNPLSMISTSVIQLVDFIKLDKHVVKNQCDKGFLILVKALIEYAHQAGKQVVLEGIETKNDLAFAKSLNVDLVQGFLYKELFLKH